jgi:hypothetical protein
LLNPECKQQSQIGYTPHYSLHLKFLKFLEKKKTEEEEEETKGRYKLQTLESSSEENNKDIAPKFPG